MNILYMVDSGSSLGAALAAREKGCNRVILFVGEGSL
jgi:TPP-dependent 2-oxoacid decarboxylase